MTISDPQRPKRSKIKPAKGAPTMRKVEGYNVTHEEWMERFDAFLSDQPCTLYGRAFDIHSTSGRRDCAEFLARSVEGVLK